ncbi:helix-turn-helix domain-containing protein [Candidatus Micrarchaeota archaeon]|nr:helix-turn-helix domain-containing protein [Candidatus Micrarchaeota archaeon]
MSREDRTLLKKILYLYFEERLSIRAIAGVLNVSHMKVYRMLSRNKFEAII